MTLALIGFAVVLILAFMRMPLGVALGLVGLVGFSELSSYRAGMSNAARLVIDSGQSYGLSVVPLFILMGLMVDRGGMAKELYRRNDFETHSFRRHCIAAGCRPGHRN